MRMGFIGCTAEGLDTLSSVEGGVSCWLHIISEPPPGFKEIVSKLLNIGCRHFAISGLCAEKVHDEVDDVVEDRDDLILTTWCTGTIEDAASEFLAVNCPGGGTSLRLAVVFSPRGCEALFVLAEMIRYLSLMTSDEG
jgi:hypothetical protein